MSLSLVVVEEVAQFGLRIIFLVAQEGELVGEIV